MVAVTCQQCGLKILVPSTVQGRRGVCFGCGAALTVPKAEIASGLDDLEFAEGQRVSDRYVIKQPLGKGGMGVVYHALDELIGEDVALKFMRPRLLTTQKGQQMFIREAQLVRRLRHEHIVAVHDVSSTAEGILYISMELLQGRSLRDMVRVHRKEKRLIKVRLIVSLMTQVLRALEHAHKTVVHRDVKPENVMILPGERVKVLDFGLAQALHEEALIEVGKTDASGRKRVVGTLAYTSPEQRKHQSVDLRTDIYSAGLVLREMFTLHTPMDEPITIGEFRSDVSPSIIKVVDKATHPDRDQRWQSVREFRKALVGAYNDSYQSIVVMDNHGAAGKTASTENMVYFEGGSFMMGNKEVPEEAPEFEAYVEPFYIDLHPVTVAEYEQFLQETGRAKPKFWGQSEFNGAQQPVIGVTWHDAKAYAEWAGKQLPTETQWEFAARGRESRKYPWGAIEPDSTRCNMADYLGMPSIVTMHEEGKTPEGLLDMGGNVYEWTLDPFVQYRPNRQGPPPDVPRRVVRGGSWHSPPEDVRTSHRKGLFPEAQLTTVGFRCVLPAKSAVKE